MMLLLWFLFSTILFLSACSSTHRIGSPLPEGLRVEAESITIRKKNGEVYQAKSFRIQNDSLHFDSLSVDLIEIERIIKKERSEGKTVGLMIGIGATLMAMFGAYTMLSGIGVFGGGD